MYASILVPLDGSEHSRRALDVAARLVTPDRTGLYLLHVCDIRPTPELPAGIDAGASAMASATAFTPEELEQMDRRLDERIRHAEQSGHDLIARAKAEAELGDVGTEDIVRIGQPAEVVIEEAGSLGVEAIVMGSRGMSDLASLLVGSVSHKVMHTASCRVVLVH